MNDANNPNKIEFSLTSGTKVVAYPGDDIYSRVKELKDKGKKLVVSDEKFYAAKKTHWGWKKGVGAVKSKLGVHPLPKKSSSYGEEYQFPNDVTDVSFDDLGKWLFRLAGWQGYILRLLAVAEVEKSIMTDTFNLAVTKHIIKKEKRVSKEIAASEMMQENLQLRELKIALVEKDAEVLGLKRIADIYSFQYEAISREITRRAIEQKRTSHGLMPEGSE